VRNVDVAVPRGSLTVFYGLFGSGKSFLAFGTIFANRQPRSSAEAQEPAALVHTGVSGSTGTSALEQLRRWAATG